MSMTMSSKQAENDLRDTEEKYLKAIYDKDEEIVRIKEKLEVAATQSRSSFIFGESSTVHGYDQKKVPDNPLTYLNNLRVRRFGQVCRPSRAADRPRLLFSPQYRNLPGQSRDSLKNHEVILNHLTNLRRQDP